jgi:hypothetical protein
MRRVCKRNESIVSLSEMRKMAADAFIAFTENDSALLRMSVNELKIIGIMMA